MVSPRNLSMSKPAGGNSLASQMIREQIKNKNMGAKQSSGARYKKLVQKKLEESRNQVMMNRGGRGGPMSKKAEEAMKQMAMKKAAKQAKIERKAVVIKPRGYANGKLNKDGSIVDIAGNRVAKVNRKNGNISSNGGMMLGRYKPGSYSTNQQIQNIIDKNSPYLLNLRKMQAMQAGGSGEMFGVHGPSTTEQVISLYGGRSMQVSSTLYGANDMAEDNSGVRTGPGGATAWGYIADNTWGNMSDNTWGTTADNVWGTANGDVWGGVGNANSLWGVKMNKIWGTGNGKNYIKGITGFISAFLGLKAGKGGSGGSVSERVNAYRGSKNGGSGSSSGSGSTRSSTPTRSAAPTMPSRGKR